MDTTITVKKDVKLFLFAPSSSGKTTYVTRMNATSDVKFIDGDDIITKTIGWPPHSERVTRAGDVFHRVEFLKVIRGYVNEPFDVCVFNTLPHLIPKFFKPYETIIVLPPVWYIKMNIKRRPDEKRDGIFEQALYNEYLQLTDKNYIILPSFPHFEKES